MNNENNDTCPICINEFQKNDNGNMINFAVTSCGHKFCLHCIIRHSISKYTCPLCRQIFLDPLLFSNRPQQNININGFFSELNENQTDLLNGRSDTPGPQEILEEIELSEWYYGSWQDQLEEMNSRQRSMENSVVENYRTIPIRNITLDTSNIIIERRYPNIYTSSEYFAYHEDETSHYEPEPECDDYTSFEESIPITSYTTSVTSGPYDEAISLPSSDDES